MQDCLHQQYVDVFLDVVGGFPVEFRVIVKDWRLSSWLPMYEVIAVIAQLMKMKIKMNMKKMMNMMMIIIITITKQLTTAQLNLGFCFQLRLLLQHLFLITPFPASLHQVAALTPPRAPATNSFAWRQGRNVLRLTCLRASDSPSLRVYIRTAPQLEGFAIYCWSFLVFFVLENQTSWRFDRWYHR